MKSRMPLRVPGLGFSAALTLLTAFVSAQEQVPATVRLTTDKALIWTNRLENASQLNAQFVDVSGSLLADNGLGVDVSELEPALRSQLGLAQDQGLIVTAVPEESQGHKDGLKIHDVIVEVKGTAVGKPEQFKELLQPVGKGSIALRLLRAGQPVVVKVNPIARDLAQLRLAVALDDAVALANQPHYRLGVQLGEIDDALRAQLRLASGEGLLVAEVIEKTPAEEAGIVAHDVLTVLDGKRLTTVEAINAQIQEIKDREVELRLLRQGKEVSLQITPRKTEGPAVTNDSAITLWDVQNCRGCHASAHGAGNPYVAWSTLAGSLRHHPQSSDFASHFHLFQNINQPSDQNMVARRLFLDLVGRLPSPDELKSLDEDKSPEAFSNVVKQLLGSEEFTERWARLGPNATAEGQAASQATETERQVETLELELSQAQEAIRALKNSLQRGQEPKK